MAIMLLAGGLSVWGWWMTRGSGENGRGSGTASGVLVARPVPAGGWGAMRVMVANVRLDQPADGENGWLKRRELLVKTMLKYQPEILACQEVAPAQGAYLNKELATWYAYYPRAGVGRGTASQSGGTRSAASELLGIIGDTMASMNTIYYRSDRFDILDGESGLVLPNEPQANATENTFFSLAVLREKGPEKQGGAAPARTVLVVDVHLRHGEAFAIRCANKIHEKIAGWQAEYPNCGVLLLGDMNRDRTTTLYRSIVGGSGPGGGGALVDLFDYSKMAGGTPWGTYHAFSGKTTQAWPTDLIFAGGTLHVTKAAEIVRDSAGGRYPTDHFLVMGEVGWRQGAAEVDVR
jgi:endonuclease/exonuclease/phosphatase family metal-dependent hydrolase